jgi:geranyl-CoA carboxylase alpha subunit
LGLRNNGRFLSDLVDHPAFRNAAMTTTLIDQWLEQGEPLLQAPVPADATWRLAAVALALEFGSSWRADSVAAFDMKLQCGTEVRTLRVQPDRTGAVAVSMHGSVVQVVVEHFAEGQLRYTAEGVSRTAIALIEQGKLHLALEGNSFVFAEVSAFPSADALQDASRARSPVAGKVTQISVAAGDAVQNGQQLVCVEAMKMEMWLCAQADGTVAAVHAKVGDQVESGAVLVELTLQAASETIQPKE